MILTIVLFLVIGLSGFLTRLPKETRFFLPKALLLTIVETLIGTIFFALNMWLLVVTKGLNVLLSGVNSIFLVFLLIAFVNGLLLYGLQCIFFKKIKVETRVLTLMEYIIQWSLIYITVYQVLYDNILPQMNISVVKDFSVSNPSELMIGILPSLISVWVAVILYKLKKDVL